MRCDAREYGRARRSGRATSVRVAPTGTAVEQYQVPLGQRHSLKEAGVIGLPSWSEKSTQNETWVRVPRLSATCPRRVVAFDGGKSSIDKTMEFGDDFDGAAIDTSKWASYSGVTISGGKALLDPDEYLGTTAVYSRPITIGAVIEATATNTGWEAALTYGNAVPMATHQAAYMVGAFSGSFYFIHNNGTAFVVNQNLSITQAANTQYNIEMALSASQVRVYVWAFGSSRPGTPSYTYTDSSIDSKKVFFGHTGLSCIEKVDLVFVRKYTANEPLTGTAQPTATNRALSRPMSHADLMRACCT